MNKIIVFQKYVRIFFFFHDFSQKNHINTERNRKIKIKLQKHAFLIKIKISFSKLCWPDVSIGHVVKFT